LEQFRQHGTKVFAILTAASNQARKLVVIAENAGVIGKEAELKARHEHFQIVPYETHVQKRLVQPGHLIRSLAVDLGFFHDLARIIIEQEREPTGTLG
jgi:hypothetical protein